MEIEIIKENFINSDGTILTGKYTAYNINQIVVLNKSYIDWMVDKKIIIVKDWTIKYDYDFDILSPYYRIIKFQDLNIYKCIYLEHHMNDLLFKKIFYKIPFQYNAEFKNIHSITFKHKYLQTILQRLEDFNYHILLDSSLKSYIRQIKLNQLI